MSISSLEPRTVCIGEVVEAVEELGEASVELVEWEFGLPARTLRELWREAIGRGLIGPVGRCSATREDLYAVIAV